MTLSLSLLPKLLQRARRSSIYATAHSVMNRRAYSWLTSKSRSNCKTPRRCASPVGRDPCDGRRPSLAVQALHEAGVGIFTYQDGREVSFETPVEKFMLGVHGFGAEEYRHQVKLKTREALHRKAARGHATGSRTYGYRLVRQGEHTEREIDAAEAMVVKRVFELSAEGYGGRPGAPAWLSEVMVEGDSQDDAAERALPRGGHL